jgi:hypothetical protein
MSPRRRGSILGPLPPRQPLSLRERQRLRSVGTIAGGLVGIGVAVLIPGLLFTAIALAFALSGFGGIAYGPRDLAALILVVLGLLLVIAGWVISLRRLRHWGEGSALRVTAAATSFAGITAVLADAAIVGLFVALEAAQIAPTEWALVPVAGVLGIVAGALIGGVVWPWIGKGLRPQLVPERP